MLTIVAFVLLGVFAEYRWRHGFGGRSGNCKNYDFQMRLLAAVGFAIRPMIVGLIFWAACMLSAIVKDETQIRGVGIFGGVLGIFGTIAILWGVKEFVRPSSWRRVPPWILERERQGQR